MKILFVSNYEPWGLVAKGLMPSNHLFGIKEALTGLNEKKSGCWGGIFNDGTVDFLRITKCRLNLFCTFSKYDVVYDGINVVSKMVGVVNKECH